MTKKETMNRRVCAGFQLNMMTSSNGNIFRVAGPVCGEFPSQRPVTRNFDVCFDLFLNKRLSKQSWGWWIKTPSRPLWRHNNEMNFKWLSFVITSPRPEACFMGFSALINRDYASVICIIYYHRDGTGCWNYVLWQTRTRLSCIINAIVAEGLAGQGAGASVAMILA